MENNNLAMEEERRFLSLCGESDRRKLEGKEPMTAQDLKRLSFIACCIGMERYDISLLQTWEDQMAVICDEVEEESVRYGKNPPFMEGEESYEERERWIKEFLEQVPPEEKLELECV